jgi:hypothetical protein
VSGHVVTVHKQGVLVIVTAHLKRRNDHADQLPARTLTAQCRVGHQPSKVPSPSTLVRLAEGGQVFVARVQPSSSNGHRLIADFWAGRNTGQGTP